MLELNSSFLWIFFLLWLLYFVLDRVFFRPIGGIIQQRETKIAADRDRHEGVVAAIEAQARAVEERLSQARREAQRTQEEWLKRGEEVRSRAVAEARERAARVLEENTVQLEKEIAVAEQALLQQVSAFSAKIRQSYL